MVPEVVAGSVSTMDRILPQLLSPTPQEVQQCVAQLMSEVETRCEELVEALVKDAHCSRYLAALCQQLETPNVRLCSNIAYILGTVAEDPTLAELLVDLAEGSTDWDLLGILGAMLQWEDAEAVMNAAGALGTLAENGSGRRWLLSSPEADFIIENITKLLDSPSDWTASNCALVLARISMCHQGCARLLAHSQSDLILRKIIKSLHVDEAGCGLNAAFTLGRLCDTDTGWRRVLNLPEAGSMISSLEAMMSGGDAGASRNACFALTCLATSEPGHEHILRSECLPRVLDTLCRLLESAEQESCWFAAITVKTLSKFPTGVVCLRQHPFLEAILKKVAEDPTAGLELLEEVEVTLQKLQRLPQPVAPKARIMQSGSVVVDWEEFKPASGLPVTYSLFDANTLLFCGPSFSYVIAHSKPGQHHLKIVMETEGDRSPDSPITTILVEEPLPECPSGFQVVGRTATKVKLSWSPPPDSITSIKYYVLFRENTLVETTTDLTCIVAGLSPSTSYTFSVCSCNSRGQSPKVSLTTRTLDKGDHAPDKLTVYVIGRSEMFITWEVPKDPFGRFFNYELNINGRSVYLGTERSYTARRLTPNTDYTCIVCAITSEGRFDSRPVTKRTAKDEYSNLNKNQIGSNRHSISSPTTEGGDRSERLSRSEGLRRNSLTKNQSVRPAMSRQTSKIREDSQVRSRRGSVIASESTEDPIVSNSSQTQSISTCDIPNKFVDRNNQEQSNHDKKPDILPRRNSIPPKQNSSKYLDITHPIQTHLADVKKPQSTLGFKLTPIASLCNLEPEYIRHHRSKTESELLRPPSEDVNCHPSVTQDSVKSMERERRFQGYRKALQPMRDPLVRFRHRIKKASAWDLSGEGQAYAFSGKYPLNSKEDTTQQLSLISKNLERKDDAKLHSSGTVESRNFSWPQLCSELSQLRSLKSLEVKTEENNLGHRRKGSLSESLHKDIQAFIGNSGVTFQLPPPPNSLLQTVRPHH
ncbi:uncharacterized protein PAF06_000326 [Gastrophryne carolinensis]